MTGKLPVDDRREPFRTRPADLTNPRQEPALPASATDRQYLEDEFKSLYSGKPGRRAIPIRLTAGVLMLKDLKNPGDEKIPEARESSPYFQYFCGGVFFEHKFPCDPGDFVHFRRRAVNQQKKDTDRVYCLHRPITECIAKGNPHSPYEFGNKAGLITGGKKGKKNHFGNRRFYRQPL